MNIPTKTFHGKYQNPFSPVYHFNDSLLVQLSCKYPIQTRFDRVYGINWRYRMGGDSNSDEIVVFIASAYESCSSYIYLLDKLASKGYRVVSIDLGGYDKYKRIAKGFDQFMDIIKAKKAHLISDGFGGFVALEIASYENLFTKILSISLINSFVSPDVYRKPGIVFNVLGKLTASIKLKNEIEEFNMADRGYLSAIFLLKEIESVDKDVLAARIKLRNEKIIPIHPQCDAKAIMSIETLDRGFNYPNEYLPSVAIKDCRQALMKFGGDWPHIENPDDTLQYLTAHLRKFGKIPLLPEETNEEEMVND